MSSNPVNLAVRFLLELAALVALGLWGARQGTGAVRYVGMLGVPLVGAALWGTFAVPGDPSRSGRAPVAVSGLVRLLLEATFFGGATWALYTLGARTLGVVFGGIVVLHYVVSYDRVVWLLRR